MGMRPAVEKNVADEFMAIVGEAHVRNATERDAVEGQVPWIVVEPATEIEVSQVLKVANDNGLGVIPRAGCSKLGWGNAPARADIILSLRHLNRVIEHAWADMTVSVEAGCGVRALQKHLAEHGQRLAIDTIFEERATVGGILATNESGSLRLRFGPLRDLIIGITIVLPDGTIARSGGKVVKNVAGYDLPKLMTGALGTLGVITSANFRLHPLPKHSQTLSRSYSTAAEANAGLLKVLDSHLVTSSMQIRVENGAFNLDTKFESNVAGLDTQIEKFTSMLGGASAISDEVWNFRGQLFGDEHALVVKCSSLRTELASLIDAAQTLAQSNAAKLSVVSQATGVSFVRIEGRDDSLLTIAKTLRSGLESNGGSLVILRAPEAIKPQLDVWGGTGNALPLMKKIKKQFDPNGILNPGRFYGAI